MDGLVEGRIVHWVLPVEGASRGKHRPAIIVDVEDRARGVLALTVFPKLIDTSEGLIAIALENVSYSEKAEPGTWHWPEKVS